MKKKSQTKEVTTTSKTSPQGSNEKGQGDTPLHAAILSVLDANEIRFGLVIDAIAVFVAKHYHIPANIKTVRSALEKLEQLGLVESRKNGQTWFSKPRSDGVVNPSIQRREQLIVNVRAALDKLENTGRAAVALCLMNADTIEQWVREDSNCERFNVPNFIGGAMGIARDVAFQFESARALYREGIEKLIGEGIAGLGLCEMEDSVSALKHLLCVQTGIMETPRRNDVVGCNNSAEARLKIAWENSYRAGLTLHEFQHPLKAAA
jgi:predicted MarR family transcription regulator